MSFYPSLFIYGFSVVCLILTYIFESIISESGRRLFVGNFSFKIQAKFCSFPHSMDIFGGPWGARCCSRCWGFIIIQLTLCDTIFRPPFSSFNLYRFSLGVPSLSEGSPVVVLLQRGRSTSATFALEILPDGRLPHNQMARIHQMR